ncbi:AAA family ATPase [Deinococcus altitudinis]|uniref:AAA family ATPase n=1 Tax=Deinococcus altitudinis TaxID=468914 RepID=UPI003891762F
MSAQMIVFSGLPGSGKSTLARRLAGHLGAAYLRIDSVEAALLNATGHPASVEGYMVAYTLAADQLELGLDVVADCVNPLQVTRDAWAAVATRAGCPLLNIEVVCSDVAEHRRRVETRQADPATHAGQWQPPTWAQVQDGAHDYEPWTASRVVLDTATRAPDALFAELLSHLGS